ncbi:MAG TPA: hypothetical protein DCY13_16745, partial [Verrucomicrobiales bacterium]|nr:hypothetical protein [Verrucomicrobiales bacterium]
MADTRFVGRAISAADQSGIDGARVTLEATPTDGVPEAETTTDPFGFFEFANAPAGSLELRIEHGGFAARVETINIAPDTTLSGVYPLSPVPGARPDFQVVVSDVMTGIALFDVPVQLDRFNGANDPDPAESYSGRTDADGNLWFRGLPSGSYRFRANDTAGAIPRWLPFTTAGTTNDHQLISSTHSASIMLEPEGQNVTVRIEGLDPASADPFFDTQASLEGVYVEVEGLDPQDLSSVVLPKRTSVTGFNGEVLFTGLPAVPLRVTTKRMGYHSTTAILNPDPVSGAFPTPHTIPIVLKPTHLFVQLESIYTNVNAYSFLEVRLQGLDMTGTEGIDRVQTFTYIGFPEQRGFFNLLPGRYRVSANGRPPTSMTGGITPEFKFSDIIDVTEGVWTSL